METITSADNQKIKHIKKLLTDKKYRTQSGEYIAEGARWVADALKLAPKQVAAVFFKESYEPRLCELLNNARQTLGTQHIFTVSDSVFEKSADTEHSQGILAVMKPNPAELHTAGSHCLFLDGIRDPGNLGTIIRTAVAAGFDDLILADCADVYNPKVVRSSMSALLKVRFTICGGESEKLLESFKQKGGYRILAADMNGENIFTNREKFDKIILIIGSEANGIRPVLKTLADKIVSVPMQHVESLNAAVSAGILMYQLKPSL